MASYVLYGSTRPARWPRRPASLAVVLRGRFSRHSPPPHWRAACSFSSESSPSATLPAPSSGRSPAACRSSSRTCSARGSAAALASVIFAVFVCALAVHAASVRLMFAMARDNNLPFAHLLSHVPAQTRAPVVPSVVVGVLAAASWS